MGGKARRSLRLVALKISLGVLGGVSSVAGWLLAGWLTLHGWMISVVADLMEDLGVMLAHERAVQVEGGL
jgi:hypothetical protein